MGVLRKSQSPQAQDPGALTHEGGRRWASQPKERERISPSSAFLFYLGPQQIGWYLHTLVKRDLLYSVY